MSFFALTAWGMSDSLRAWEMTMRAHLITRHWRLWASTRWAGCRRAKACRFRNLDEVARQGSDAQQRLRTAQSGVCRARPSRARHAFAPRYNRWHISQGFGEGDPRSTR